MNRREALETLGAAGLAAAMYSPAVAAFQPGRREARSERRGHDHHMREVSRRAAECMNECSLCFHHCFIKVSAGAADYARSMHCCVDCAEVCAVTATLAGRMSSMTRSICAACADACDECRDACEKHNDPEMRPMIDACRSMAATCREMTMRRH